MQYLKRMSQALLAAGGLTMSFGAWADGTDSGVTVTNGVTMSFSVSGVGQTANDSVSFLVDRKLRLDVGTLNANWVTAVAGQSQTASNASSISFEVTNNSNDSVDVVVALIDQSNIAVDGYDPVGASPIVPTSLTVWEDTNGDGVLDGSENVLGNAEGVYTLSDPIDEDNTATISVSIDVANGTTAELYQTYTLVAAVADGSGALANDDSGNLSPGAPAVAVTPNDLNAVEIVFADDGSGSAENDDIGYDFVNGAATGVLDQANDGQSANAAGFRTVGVLGIAKYVEVLWDPISGNQYNAAGTATTGNEPKAIPGAVVMYLIGVNNQSPIDATGVTISDNIPGGQPNDPLLLGNAGAVAGINLPDTVTVTIDGSPVVFDVDNTNINVDNQVYIRECDTNAAAAVGTPVAFDTDSTAEVNAASMGASCVANSSGYVVYFATVDDTAS